MKGTSWHKKQQGADVKAAVIEGLVIDRLVRRQRRIKRGDRGQQLVVSQRCLRQSVKLLLDHDCMRSAGNPSSIGGRSSSNCTKVRRRALEDFVDAIE